MFRVTVKLDFCYGHRLLGYEGKCVHLHGHTGITEIAFEKESLDSNGMVLDFVKLKKEIKIFLNEELDHKMLLKKDDPLIEPLRELGEPVFVMQDHPTAENIARVIFNFAVSRGLPVVSVRLWETPDSYAEFHE